MTYAALIVSTMVTVLLPLLTALYFSVNRIITGNWLGE